MPCARPSRRAVVGGVLGTATLGGVGASGACSHSVGDPSPDTEEAGGEIDGSTWGGDAAAWRLAWPRRTAPRALVVCLHGKGGTADSSFQMGFDARAAEHDLAFVSVSGGDGYWHRRRDGRDSARLVLDELIPLARKGAGLPATIPVAFIGWSMGGYGALLLAGRLPRELLLGVATLSAALWTSAGATAAGAFDDAEDYAAYDVFAASRLLPTVPVSMACGSSDPFIRANRVYAAARPGTRTTFDRGGHDGEYWSSHAGPAMAMLTEAL